MGVSKTRLRRLGQYGSTLAGFWEDDEHIKSDVKSARRWLNYNNNLTDVEIGLVVEL